MRYKKIRIFKIERKFKKENSVFKDWVEPDFVKLILSDLENSKIPKLIKDEEQLHGVVDCLTVNARFIVE